MLKARLILLLLFVTCFSLAAYLQPRRAAERAALGQSDDVLALLLGDGKRMFANDFYAKADAYFHRGNYPSIFDSVTHREENHMAEEAGRDPHSSADDDHNEQGGGVEPHDWVERFGRHFYPTEHVHLHDGEEREMLPWLRLSAALDPHQVRTYAVTAYWLRVRLGKPDEAEQFLRQGLQNNPSDPEILNELAWLYLENRKDAVRAKNIWIVALRRWHERESLKRDPNEILLRRILDGLTSVALQQGNSDEAIGYLEQLKQISPNPGEIQKQIDDLKSKNTGAPH